MNRFLFWLVVPLLILADILGTGFYPGWLHRSTEETGHEVRVPIPVDQGRMLEDAEEAQDLGQ
jgi:hypothetical protein